VVKEEDRYTLLFVDDEVNILNALNRSFRKEGYEILLSADPFEAIKILSERKVHLIMSDFRMPGMDGVTFLREAMKLQPDAVRMILSGYAEGPVILSAINDGGIFKFITKPWEDDLLKIEVRHALERYELEHMNKKLVQDVQRRNEILKETNRLLAEKIDEIEEGIVRTVEMLSYLARTKDPKLPDNIDVTSRIVMEVGKRMGLEGNDLRYLSIAIRLHDIGNVGIDSCILNKAAPLTPEERREVERHSVIGERVLSFLQGFEPVAKIVRHHHECYDGTGYPDGLEGEEIPLLSRIVHLADVYDSLTNDRPYRPVMKDEEVMAILMEERGKKFDPRIVDLFLAVKGETREV